jgi:two-component system OmpR family sensor kinase
VYRLRNAPGWTISLFGAALVALAVVHHGMELQQDVPTTGPVVAFTLDGFPGLTLAYAGYWLQGSRFSRDNQWRAVGWCVLGATTFAAVTTASIAVRAFEGGQLVEPLFPILLSTGVGGQAGFVAGYFYALAREDAERAERANDALSFVNSVLRHDLRNAINVVQGNASLVESSVDDPDTRERMVTIQEQTEEALDRIESAGEMVDTLVGDSDLREVDLAAVATQCGNRVADAYGVQIETDVPDAAPVVADDGLHSVVHNLVENAAEHNDADDPEIAVAVERNGDVARLEVWDNGSGFDDPAVYDGLDELTGSGGLHLVDALVDHYGGEARVSDDDLPGATVVVELPKAAS